MGGCFVFKEHPQDRSFIFLGPVFEENLPNCSDEFIRHRLFMRG
jgi:hypothetical protein